MRFTRRLAELAAFSLLAVAIRPAVSPAQLPPPTWSIDINISGAQTDETFTSGNNQRSVAIDDSNHFYLTFFDNRYKSGGDNNFEIFLRWYKPNFGWSPITRATTMANMSKFPSLATLNWGPTHPGTTADSGRVYIAWQDARLFSVPVAGEPKSYTIYMRTFQSRGGFGFGPEIQVSPYDSVNAATSPSLAVGDSSRVWIVWQKKPDEFSNTDLFYAVYNSLTRVMGPATQLTTDLASSNAPSVTATESGVVHVVWADTRSGSSQIWTKRFTPGTGWSADQQLVFSSGTSSAPSIRADGNGHVQLVWVDTRDGNNEIYHKEYILGTGWDPADLRITTNSASQIQPNVDADELSNVYVVWTDLRNGATNFDIYFAQRVASTWGFDIPCVDVVSDPTNSVQRFPNVVHDTQTQIYVAFTDERLPATGGTNKEAYYKTGEIVSAAPSPVPPTFAHLLRNYPNPFNPATTVEFELARDAVATLRVYDARGRLVRRLLDGLVASGRRTVRWDGRDDRGGALPSGSYFLRLEAGGRYQSKAVNLLK